MTAAMHVDFQRKGREIKPTDYLQALQWFLQKGGYIKM